MAACANCASWHESILFANGITHRQINEHNFNAFSEIRDSDQPGVKSFDSTCPTRVGFPLYSAEPHNSVGSVADLRTGGRWFDPRLGQYSFRGLMIVIAAGFIPHSPLSAVSTMVMWKSSKWLGKNIVRTTGYKKLQGSMDRCTGRRCILKTALNTIQSISLLYNHVE